MGCLNTLSIILLGKSLGSIKPELFFLQDIYVLLKKEIIIYTNS